MASRELHPDLCGVGPADLTDQQRCADSAGKAPKAEPNTMVAQALYDALKQMVENEETMRSEGGVSTLDLDQALYDARHALTLTEVQPIGLVPPHPERREHPCNDLTAQVHVGGGAYQTISNPFYDGGLIWRLTWGSPEQVRYVAASVVSSFNYLLSDEISMTEAIRRLRILRQAQRGLRQWRTLGDHKVAPATRAAQVAGESSREAHEPNPPTPTGTDQ